MPNQSQKTQNSNLIWLIAIVLAAALLGGAFIGMQSVGDRRTITTCDALGSWPNPHWQPTYGTIAIDTTDKTEGAASIVATRTGTSGTYMYALLFTGDAGADLTNEHTISFWYKATSFTGTVVLHFYYVTYEDETAINGDASAWTSWYYDIDAAGLIQNTWTHYECDVYNWESGGTSENGVTHDQPDLTRVTAFGWATSSSSFQVLRIDFVEVVWTGADVPSSPLTVSLNPPSASITTEQSQTFTATASGGTAPYTYAWTLNTEPQSGTASTISLSGLSAGTYQVQVAVTDDNGDTETDTSTLSVTTPGTPATSYTLTLEAIGSGSITDTSGSVLEGSYSVASGETVQLSAVATTGFQFINWKVDGTNMTGTPIEVVMTSDHSVLAYFSDSQSGSPQTGAPQDQTDTGLSLPTEGTETILWVVIGGTAIGAVIIFLRKRKR